MRGQKVDSKASKVADEVQHQLPLMDEILPKALGKVAVKGLVTGNALVAHVAKNYPKFGVKEVWLGKLKAALDMEVARGNLLLVTSLKSLRTIKLNFQSPFT